MLHIEEVGLCLSILIFLFLVFGFGYLTLNSFPSPADVLFNMDFFNRLSVDEEIIWSTFGQLILSSIFCLW